MSTIGTLKKRGKKGIWQIQFTDASGKLRRESTHTADEREAKAKLKERIGQVENGTFVASRDRVMFSHLRTLIESDYTINGRRVDNIKFVLDHLAASFGSSRAVDITATRIADYVTLRKGEKAANASVNREMSALSRMFKLAQKGGMLNFSPNVPHLQENNTREGFLAPAEFETLCAELPDWLKDPVRFLYLTGWRVGEMKTLEWRDVDTQAGMIVLRRAQSKNGRARTLPLEGEIGELIKRQRKAASQEEKPMGQSQRLSDGLSPADSDVTDATGRGAIGRRIGLKIRDFAGSIPAAPTQTIPFVFSHDGKPIGDFRIAWDTARTAAGLGNLLVHDLRRSAVRNLIRAGVSQTVAMKMTGHETASVFRRYDVSSEEDMRLASIRMQDWVIEQRQDKKVVKIGGTK